MEWTVGVLVVAAAGLIFGLVVVVFLAFISNLIRRHGYQSIPSDEESLDVTSDGEPCLDDADQDTNDAMADSQRPHMQKSLHKRKELNTLYHFRHCVQAVLQMSAASPEVKDHNHLFHTYIRTRHNGTSRRIKRMASFSRTSTRKGTLSKKTISPILHLPKKKRAPEIGSEFCIAEHLHEWQLTKLGRVKFTDHSPVPFQFIRNYFGYDNHELVKALDEPLEIWPSQGKSEARKLIFFNIDDLQ